MKLPLFITGGGGLDDYVVRDADAKHICSCGNQRMAETIASLLTNQPELIITLLELLSMAQDNLHQSGGCDHSVGICCCTEIRFIEDTMELLRKMGIMVDCITPWETGHRLSDEQLRAIWVDVASSGHGDFLKSFADAYLRADQENLNHIRPMAVYLVWKYKLGQSKDKP